jgi:SAM-dependent methyltransferase
MKSYDREYFDRWYRDRATRVTTEGDLRLRVAMVVGITENLIGRPIRSVLDVGCGEARWQPHLARMRRAVNYVGLETSDYALERFGAARNIVRGSFGAVGEISAGEPFDLVVCSDVLHYLDETEIVRGLKGLVPLVGGVAYLSVFTREDDPTGDLAGWRRRNAQWYLSRFRRAGLVACGMQCYTTPEIAEAAAELDLA